MDSESGMGRVWLHDETGFFDRSAVIRWVLGIVFVFGLILFFQFQQVRVETLALNTVANRDVTAQIDYAFPDEEKTAMGRQDFLRELGQVYQLRVELSPAELQQLGELATPVLSALSTARFVKPATYQAMSLWGLDRRNYWEWQVHDESSPPIPPRFWFELQEKLATQAGVLPQGFSVVITHLETRTWEFEVDQMATENLHRAAFQASPVVLTTMAAGTPIIKKGNMVTAHHLTHLQAMNEALLFRRELNNPVRWVGSLLLALLLAGISVVYLRVHHRRVYYSNRLLALSILILLLTLLFSKGVEYVLLRSTPPLLEWVRFPILVPFAAILFCSLLNTRIAIYFSAFLSVAMVTALMVDRKEFLLINWMTALVAIFMVRSFRRRKEIFTVCGWSWSAALLAIFGFHCYDNTLLDLHLLIDVFSSLVFLLLTAILVVGLLPLLESIFAIVTDASLMELMDPTHPLLRRLSEEAPGTYQHSIVVGNLAETAAIAIGANGLLCRAGALYHDVGKIISPQYFTENQTPEDFDVHRVLTPLESAQAIMAHVSEGISIAKRHHLPPEILDIIRQHHGTTLVYYFYHQACEWATREKTEVHEHEFRYNGPKPRLKEAVIVMIADAAEAAARSLDEITEDQLSQLVDQIVRDKAEDGQFDESAITFEELAILKRTLVRSLTVASHSRVKYPSRGTGGL